MENTVRKLAYGTIFGFGAALILFRARAVIFPSHARGSCCCVRAHLLCPARPAARARRLTRRAARAARFDARRASVRRAGSPAARSAITGLGAGVGVGMGYTDCKVEFDTIAKASGK